MILLQYILENRAFIGSGLSAEVEAHNTDNMIPVEHSTFSYWKCDNFTKEIATSGGLQAL